MLRLGFVVWMVLVGLMVLDAGVVSGQDYPNKPIRIVTGEIGGGSDLVARIIAQALSGNLSQQVIVENRTGLISVEVGSKAPPDGYTLILSGSLWIFPLLQKVSFDPVKDFSPIALVASTPNVLVVHSSLPVKSVKELIALAKARPGELNYGSGPIGSTSHLAGELFKTMADVKIVGIPFRGNGPALIALIGGEMQLMFGNAGGVVPHVKSGKLRSLAVTSARPSVLAPGLPTVAAAGLPGYEVGSIIGIFAPAGTPTTIVNRLNQEIVRVLNQADVKEKFLNAGTETVGNSPGEFSVFIKSDMARMGKVIKAAGIRAE